MGFWDDLTGKSAADAANKAALDTYGKQQRAIEGITQYGNEFADQFKTMGQGYNPYIQGGGQAYQQLLGGLGMGGAEGSQQFTDAYRALPGYQNGLQTGSEAITGNKAARGMLNSGSTLKGLQRFGSDYEDKRSGDYLSRLMGVGTQGLGALTAQNATVGQGLQGQLGTRQSAFNGGMQSAGTIGQGQVAGANAESAGAGNLVKLGMQGAGMLMGMPSFGSAFGGSSGGNLGTSFQQGQYIPTYY